MIEYINKNKVIHDIMCKFIQNNKKGSLLENPILDDQIDLHYSKTLLNNGDYIFLFGDELEFHLLNNNDIYTLVYIKDSLEIHGHYLLKN
jgi:hypothetical protein